MSFTQILDNPIINLESMEPGEISWRSPSNIAIVKYWGKYGLQLPQNPNLSFSLNRAYTQTKVSYRKKSDQSLQLDLTYLFDGAIHADFNARIEKYFIKLMDYFPFIRLLSFYIESKNSFPHSSGIASSASSMSALALCLCSIENSLYGTLSDQDKFLKKASFIARLGSGSAARSVYPGVSTWGKSETYLNSSDEYAIDINENIHDSFRSLQDSILLVSKTEKSVSSSAGHALMNGNPYAEIRYETARKRLGHLAEYLKKGDWSSFGLLAEQEALDLHALMMTSSPSYVLMEPNTLEVIHRIRKFRAETKHHVYFTLDAGPNVHVLFPKNEQKQISTFIHDELLPLCQNKEMIQDEAGKGPILIDN